MLSRVASNLFWIARNVERAESSARVLKTRLINALETSEAGPLAEGDWEMILDICAVSSEYYDIHPVCEAEKIARYICFDRTNINSIINCMENARNNARSVREVIPEDLWEILNEHHLSMQNENVDTWSMQRIHEYLRDIQKLSFSLQGVIEASMLREEAYNFIKVGKWMERGEKTARVLNVVSEKTKELKLQTETDHYYYWLSALQFLNGYDAYLKRFPPKMEPAQVISFLISYEQFPRSIEYCMEHVRETVMKLESGQVSHYSEELFDAMDRVTQEFMKIKFRKLGMDEIGPFLDKFQNDCNRISSIFARTYYFV
ncbi:alpha-E domain-containing protein [Alkalicoccus saliphilus]|jgi:uncharacterized alpha-E superfamily protein|uniref:alpha-E domain-containing protein n=1 Tax=Alkalicoccus saliphilus TaxID=200989 RepID=UPI001FEB5ED5|nr:alpha-E domain-containing protein [Alkalicoccus saliphilus]